MTINVGDRVEARVTGEVIKVVEQENGTTWVRVRLDEGRVGGGILWDVAERVEIVAP